MSERADDAPVLASGAPEPGVSDAGSRSGQPTGGCVNGVSHGTIHPMGPRHLRLALPFVAALAACGGDGVVPVSGGACVTNNQCPTDEICIGGTCTAAGVTGCQTEADCSATEFCERATGECKLEESVGCSSDAVCPAHQRCSLTTGVCIDGARACTAEAGCTPIGQHCDTTAGECRECLDATHCPSGRVCEMGSCVTPSNPNACTADFACMPPSTICESGACVPGCGTAGCGAGLVCNTTNGRCVAAPMGCAMDSQCTAPSQVCEGGQCVPGCSQLGGLQCSGGNVCDSTTGRCVPTQTNCATDPQCGPPLRVCEASQCVPGCSQAGGIQCTGSTVCDTTTGRCVAVQGPCQADAQCGPPTTVCESGQCIPGCAQPGGIQCAGNTTCNAGTGRCDPGTGTCASDAQCGAPAAVCNGGTCGPGCSQTGCPGTQQCNTATGRCGNGPPPVGTGSPLDATCTANADCQSRVCFDFGGGVGARCVASCGAGADCPSGFTCFDNLGAHLCVSASLFSGASFSSPPGAACSGPAQCQSGFCDEQVPRACREQCTDSVQCAGGACRWTEFTQDIYAGLCGAPSGLPAGAGCSNDSACGSGVCFQNTCSALCSATADCANGSTCQLFNYSICTFSFLGSCLEYSPNFVKACAAGPHGQSPVGGSCTGFQTCRSALCHVGLSQCTDTCAVDADCPATHRCKVELFGALDDGTDVFLNVCLPEGA